MLSRRRLVFTDDQVYFECNSMNCYESVSIPLDELHVKNKSRQRDCFRAGVFGLNGKQVFGGLDLNTLSAHRIYIRYLGAVEEYSFRDLRYDIDSLDAFIGVARKFESLRRPYLHIWGLPYPSFVEITEACNHFANSLTWVHTQNCWDSIGKPRRRAGFPSWSWSGWAGKVSFSPHKEHGYEKFWIQSQLGAISFEYDSKNIFGFAQMAHHPFSELAHSSFPQVLVLQATVLPPEAFSYSSETNTWKVFYEPAKLHLSHGPISPSEFYDELRFGDTWKCIVIGRWLRCKFIMIIESHDGFASRAGIFQISASSSTESYFFMKLNTLQKTEFRIY